MSDGAAPARHSIPHDAIPDPVLEICRTLRKHGHGTWIVGGCVRDILLGRSVHDWDVATSATPNEVKQIFRRVVPTGIQHGTVTVLLGGGSYEVTTLRGEGAYSDGRRPDSVHFVQSIDDDLARRDFTVNAIAFDPTDARLVDPFGGLGDLDARRIRAVGDALTRFREDGLRVLRAARFTATLEFELDQETARAIPNALDTFRKVSKERVRDEWLKTMGAHRPSRAFDVMRTTGVLAICCPDLVEQFGCVQNRWHAYDVWTHTMHCVDECRGDPVLRMSALMHDIGKPRTRERSEKTGDFTFYHHEEVGAGMAHAWLSEYRFSNAERERITHLVRNHLICYSNEWSDAAVRRFLTRVGPDELPSLLELARADVLAKGRPVDSELLDLDELRARANEVIAQGAALTARDLRIGGEDVMKCLGISPGPIIGAVLRKLLEEVIDDPSLNERERLLARVPDVAREIEKTRGS